MSRYLFRDCLAFDLSGIPAACEGLESRAYHMDSTISCVCAKRLENALRDGAARCLSSQLNEDSGPDSGKVSVVLAMSFTGYCLAQLFRASDLRMRREGGKSVLSRPLLQSSSASSLVVSASSALLRAQRVWRGCNDLTFWSKRLTHYSISS